MKKNNNFLTILINDSYNYLFKKKNRIILDKSENINLKLTQNESIKHSTALHTVWLLNLKRLYNLVKQKIDLENYHFIDIGCGNGIPLIYANKKFRLSRINFSNNYANLAINPQTFQNLKKVFH